MKKNQKTKNGEPVEKQTFTVVAGLLNLLIPNKRNQILAKINELVPIISNSVKLGAIYLHSELYKLVLYGRRNEIKNEFRNKFNTSKYFSQMKKTAQRAYYDISPDFQALMDNWNVDPPFLQFGSQCHTYAVNEYLTNFHNNVKQHAKARILKFFRMWTDDKDAVRRTIRYLFHDDQRVDVIDPEPVVPDYWLLFTYRNEIGPLLTRNERERDLTNPDDDNYMPRGWFLTLWDDVKWYKHVYKFIQIQMCIYDYNIEHQNQQIKSFVVVPQRKSASCHIRIDSKALATIGISVETDDVAKAMLRKVRDEKLTVGKMKKVFERFFNLDKMNRGNSQFEYALTTNGVSCHYQKARYIPKIGIVDEIDAHDSGEENDEIDAHDFRAYEWIDEFNQSRPSSILPRPTRAMKMKYATNQYKYIIGMDPGYRLPVALVRKDISDSTEQNHTMTYQQFHKRCGAGERKSRLHKINHKLEVRLRRVRHLFPETPSCKSRNFEYYIQYQLLAFNFSFRVYQSRSIARMRFDKYIRTQNAVHDIAKEITKGQPCIISIGNFSFSPNSPIGGSVRCPMRALYKVLSLYADVVEVNEYRTSINCSICGARMSKKGGSKNRTFVCHNRKPFETILPRPPSWTSKLHHSKVNQAFNRLPDDVQRYYDHQIFRDGLPMETEIRRSNIVPTERTYVNRDDTLPPKHPTISWNRDINAPRNMIYLLKCQLEGEEKSQAFARSA